MCNCVELLTDHIPTVPAMSFMVSSWLHERPGLRVSSIWHYAEHEYRRECCGSTSWCKAGLDGGVGSVKNGAMGLQPDLIS